MRLATWNCQPGLESHWDAIEELDVDVIVVQEARSGTPDQVAGQWGWMCEYQEGKYYPGIAVLARYPYTIERRELSEPYAISTLITGSEHFRFVGFWAMTEKSVGYSYHRQARRVVEQLPDDGVPTVVAGDFNAEKHPSHLANVERLRERGLVSAYHKHRDISHTDVEEDKTAYTGRRGGAGFHIDLVFVPDVWRITDVQVGTFDQYPGRGRSDHVPVVVTISTT